MLKRFLALRRVQLAASLAALTYYFSRRAQPTAPGLARHPVVATIVRLRAIATAMQPVARAALLRAKALLAGHGVLAEPSAAPAQAAAPKKSKGPRGAVAVAVPTGPAKPAARVRDQRVLPGVAAVRRSLKA